MSLVAGLLTTTSLVQAQLLDDDTLINPKPESRLEKAAASSSQAVESLPSLSTSTSDSSSATSASSNSKSTTGTASSSGDVSITQSGSASADASITAIPTISISGNAGLPVLSSALPTIAGAYHYEAPIVPSTKGAPYIKSSKLPQGTVFIVAGAALGLFGLLVIFWRGVQAWNLHRSVRKAQEQQSLLDAKAMLGPPGGGFYAGPSSQSIEQLAHTGRLTKQNKKNQQQQFIHQQQQHHQLQQIQQQQKAARSSLFFSPTSGAVANAGSGIGAVGTAYYSPTNLNQPNIHVGSTFLPAGYYPVGAANNTASNAAPAIQFDGAAQTTNGAGYASLTNATQSDLRLPLSQHQYDGPSSAGPPSLPSLQAQAGNGHKRAPSAFLDELLDNEPPPRRQQRGSGYR
jgi:hypothetical protein